MSLPRIVTTATLFPRFQFTHRQALKTLMGWVETQNDTYKDRARKIFENSVVEQRHAIAPMETLFSPRSIEEVSHCYEENAIALGQEILKKALAQAKWHPDEVDYLVTTSCTGLMLPSFSAFLINELGLRRNVRKLPITEFGCVAGVASYSLAIDLFARSSVKKMAIISLEFPSNTIQLDDYSLDNLVGTAIFADGVSCTLLDNGEERFAAPSSQPLLEMVDSESYQVPYTTELIGYHLRNGGLTLTLDRRLPSLILDNIDAVLAPLLARNNLTIEEVDEFLVHPGGPKIINKLETHFAKWNISLERSMKIMNRYGNLSSATIGVILNDYLRELEEASGSSQERRRGKRTVVLLGFGPGLQAYAILLRGTDE